MLSPRHRLLPAITARHLVCHIEYGTLRINILCYRTYQLCNLQKPDIICLQETHSQKSTHAIWKNETKSEIIFLDDDSNARGVAIVIRKEWKEKIKKQTIDMQGRFIIVDVDIEDKFYTIVNLYAPNIDDPNFFIQLFEQLSQHENSECIITGDFNLVLNKQLDTSSTEQKNNKQAKQVIEHYVNEMMLVDAWRALNPDKKVYTWTRSKPKFTGSRIDFFLINYGLMHQVQSNIVPACSTDHSLVTLSISIDKIKRGKGNWKMNEAHLQNDEYIQMMTQEIEEDIYNFYKEKPDQKWETIKETIQIKSKIWSKNKAVDNKQRMNLITQKLQKIQDQISNGTSKQNNELINVYEKYKELLDHHIERIAKGAIVRSKQIWYEKGECCSSYFLGLEKLRYSNKMMKKLYGKNDKVLYKQHEIMQEQLDFYQKLYTSNTDIVFTYENNG